jgi:galactose mutarotase-like enzyme
MPLGETTVWIGSDALRAGVDPFGAGLVALRDARGLDLLWDGDPAVWNGQAPILFPIVGALNGGRYRLGEETFALERHGFARRRAFTLMSRDARSAVFRLEADAGTRALYPFDFALDMAFTVDGATLGMTATVRNTGAEPLPASFGFHPAFRWPLPYGAAREAHVIRFEADEPAAVRLIDGDGLLRAAPEPTPVRGDTLALTDALFTDDVLIFDALKSRRLRYGPPEEPALDIAFPDAACLGLWTKPGAGYLCIEPWRGIADPQGFAGDLRDKPGVVLTPPGGVFTATLRVTLTGA